jgi:hypothetical protein
MANLRANSIVGVGSTDAGVVFDGVTKIKTQNYFYLQTGNTENRGRGRGIFGGAEISASPSFSNAIEYIQIQTQGNAIDFGDLSQAKRFPVACSSSTRGVFGGGGSPSNTNVIEYITISSTSNSTDFGDLILPTSRGASCSSSTRGLFGGGYAPATPTLSNAIDYITIASAGNSNDFGDLTVSRFGPGAFSSSSRGVFFGGSVLAPSPATYTNTIDYVTISSIGNALDFGDILVAAIREVCGCSSSTRGVYGSGYIISTPTTILSNVLEYITISSTGNGIDFGDLTSGKVEVYGSTSNSIRGVWGGGQTPGLINSIDYITITSTGNAQDFGDLIVARCGAGACSDSHGGIEG